MISDLYGIPLAVVFVVVDSPYSFCLIERGSMSVYQLHLDVKE